MEKKCLEIGIKCLHQILIPTKNVSPTENKCLAYVCRQYQRHNRHNPPANTPYYTTNIFGPLKTRYLFAIVGSRQFYSAPPSRASHCSHHARHPSSRFFFSPHMASARSAHPRHHSSIHSATTTPTHDAATPPRLSTRIGSIRLLLPP